jgi:hypothetical protein
MTIDVPAWLGLLVTIVGLASAGGAAIAIARSSAAKASVEILTTINTELRADNADLRGRLEVEHTTRLSDKHECDAQIAEMRGRLDAATSSLGETIGREVVRSVGREVIAMMRDSTGHETLPGAPQ